MSSNHCLLQNCLAFLTTQVNQNLLSTCSHLPLPQLLVSSEEEGLIWNGHHGHWLQLYSPQRMWLSSNPCYLEIGPLKMYEVKGGHMRYHWFKIRPKSNGWPLYGKVGGGDVRARKAAVWPWHIWSRRRNWNSTCHKAEKVTKVPRL